MTSTEVISKIIEAGVNDDLKEAERVLHQWAFDYVKFYQSMPGPKNESRFIYEPHLYELFLNHQKEQP